MNRDQDLHVLAREAGVQAHWTDALGADQSVAPEVLRHVLGALGLSADSPADIKASREALRTEADACPPGVTAQAGTPLPLSPCVAAGATYRLERDGAAVGSGQLGEDQGRAVLALPDEPGYYRLYSGRHELEIASAPARCPGVADLAGPGARPWGLAAQLYSLRRDADPAGDLTGLGDYTALARLAGRMASRGCDALAISPVHAMFAADPTKYSPYAPSSRLFLNVFHADPADLWPREAIEAASREVGASARLFELEQAELIDWPEVARLRLAVLRALHAGFPDNAPQALVEDFAAFRRAGGSLLERHACFEALHARQAELGAHDWRRWDAGLRDPDSAEVGAFARAQADEIRFHALLQWLSLRGLSAAHRAATDAGMRIGLMADLAVGSDPAGSHAWSRQHDIIPRVSPGAPPDAYNAAGQSWGLTAFSPLALRRHGFVAYREILRAALAYSGGLRIDHALGMQRMWLVPEGASPREGAYVNYPFDDLMRLTALEAMRHRAVIMGENLGTVPQGFDERIAAHGMLGMSVLWFEREDAGFRPSARWSAHNIATTSTHDLPTVAGWWQGRDIDWRARLDLLGDSTEEGERRKRAEDKAVLWRTMRAPDEPAEPPEAPPLEAAARHVAATPAPLALVPLEDVLGVVEQPNLPGTIDSHPNWRRRLPVTVEALDGQAGPRLDILRRTRSA